jgi:hypothetical protein
MIVQLVLNEKNDRKVLIGRWEVKVYDLCSGQRSTSYCVVIQGPASPSCCHMCTTWSLAVSILQARAPQL